VRFNGAPSLFVAVDLAKGVLESPRGWPKLRKDGYASLNAANAWIRENLPVKGRRDYRRGTRPKLKDLHLDGMAVVCVHGHYIFLDHEVYWSFLDNEEDEVVAVWELDESQAERITLAFGSSSSEHTGWPQIYWWPEDRKDG
jgi:hypothetical protein